VDGSDHGAGRLTGSPSDFADRRGGPANQEGVDYQRGVTLYEMLRLLDVARFDFTSELTVRVEPRLLNLPVASADEEARATQFGFDLGWTDRGHEEVTSEVKRAPSAKDVREFIAKLPALRSRGIGEGNVWLIYSLPTTPVEALRRLAQYAYESGTAEEFDRLIVAANRHGDRRMLEALGADPRSSLRLVTARLLPEMVLEDELRSKLRFLARPGQANLLDREILRRVKQASGRRETIAIGDMARALIEQGLLAPAPQADTTNMDPVLAAALKVLFTCPLPVPLQVLAASAGVNEEIVAAALEPQVGLGRVAVSDGDYYSTVPSFDFPAPVEASRCLALALRELLSETRTAKASLAAQSANALSLARACGADDDETVARVFEVFDKPSKAYGDLTVVYELARVADAAARRLRRSRPEDMQLWLALRARNHICGIGWVLQRVDELEHAATAMADAAKFGERIGDADNVAFAAKCAGRLSRMRAEKEPDQDEAQQLYSKSAQELIEAFNLFRDRMAHRTGLDEDYGECKSLLARTYASMQDFSAAEETAREAHKLLDHLVGTKAHADLVVLDAEIDVRKFDASPTARARSTLRSHEQTLLGLQATHAVAPDPARSRSASEVSARILLVRATIANALGDTGRAIELTRAAADIYHRLGYAAAAEQAAWDAFVLQPGVVPAGLSAALDRLNAEPGARVIAMQAIEGDPALASDVLTDETHPRWNGIAHEAVQAHAASAIHWGDDQAVS